MHAYVVYIYIYICMQPWLSMHPWCLHPCIHADLHTHAHLHTCKHAPMHIHKHMHVLASTSIHEYHEYIYIYICIYIYINIYTHIHTYTYVCVRICTVHTLYLYSAYVLRFFCSPGNSQALQTQEPNRRCVAELRSDAYEGSGSSWNTKSKRCMTNFRQFGHIKMSHP